MRNRTIGTGKQARQGKAIRPGMVDALEPRVLYAADLTREVIYPHAGSSGDYTGEVVANFNGDAYPDLGVLRANQLHVRLNHGDGTFAAPLAHALRSDAYFYYPDAADVNQDGYDDLSVIDWTDSSSVAVVVLMNQGDGTFAEGPKYHVGTDTPQHAVFAHLNGDVYPDLAVAADDPSGEHGGLYVLLNNGAGGFTVPTRHLIGGTNQIVRLAAGDFNGDQATDVAAATGWPGSSGEGDLHLYLNDGNGSFGDSKTLGLGGVVISMTAADVDGVTGDELVAATTTATDRRVMVFGLAADGSWETPGNIAVQDAPEGSYAHASPVVVAGDFDGDGDADVQFYSDYESRSITNTGGGTFAAATLSRGIEQDASLRAADFNLDGKLDLARAYTYAGTGLMLNGLSGNMAFPTIDEALGTYYSGMPIGLSSTLSDPALADAIGYEWWAFDDDQMSWHTGNDSTFEFTPRTFDHPSRVTIPLPHHVSLRLTDASGRYTQTSMSLDVFAPPYNVDDFDADGVGFSVGGASLAIEGGAYALTFTRRERTAGIYYPAYQGSYSVDWGDGTSESFAGTGTLAHTFADGSADGTLREVRIGYTSGSSTYHLTKFVRVRDAAPTVSLGGLDSGIEGSTYSLTLDEVADPGADAAAGYLIDWGDGTGSQHVAAADMPADRTLTHIYADGPAPRTITVSVTDEDGTHVAGTKVVQVVNAAPAVSVSGPTAGAEGSPLSFTATATDPAGADDPLSYDWSVKRDGVAYPLPAGTATHHPDFTFTPADEGEYEVFLTVDDGDGGVTPGVTKLVTLASAQPSVAGPIAGVPSVGLSQHLATRFEVTSAISVSSVGAHLYTYQAGTSPDAVLVKLSGPNDFPDTADLSGADVVGRTQLPAPSGNVSAHVTAPLSATLAPGWYALVVSAAPSGLSESVAAVKNNTPTPGATYFFRNPQGAWQADPGLAGIRLAVNGTVAAGSSLTVSNVAPTLAPTGADAVAEGSGYTLQLGNVADPGQDTVASYVIDWGDGTGDRVVAAADVPADRILTHVYADGPAARPISVRVVDDDDARCGTKLVQVQNVAPSVSIAGPTYALEGAPLTFTATASDPAGAGDPLSYAWSVTRNSVSFALPGGAETAQSNFTFTPWDDGDYSVAVTVTDDDGASTSAAPQPLSLASAQLGSTGPISGVASASINASSFIASRFEVTSTLAVSSVGAHIYTFSGTGPFAAIVRLSGPNDVPDSGNLSSADLVGHAILPAPTTGASVDVSAPLSATLTPAWYALVVGSELLGATGNSVAPKNNVPTGGSTYFFRNADGAWQADPSLAGIRLAINGTAGGAGVAVANVAPTLDLVGADNFPEGHTYSLRLDDVIDRGQDTVSTYIIDWGDGTGAVSIPAANLPADRTLRHPYFDGPALHTVMVKLVDEDGTHVAATKRVSVFNIPPTVGVALQPHAAPGETVVLDLAAGDVSPVDQGSYFSYTVNWGDGSPLETFVGPAATARSHVYLSTGPRFVQAWAADQNGFSSTPVAANIDVVSAYVRTTDAGKVVVVGGGAGQDNVRLQRGSVIVSITGEDGVVYNETFSEEGVTGLEVYGLGGDDEIVVAGELTIPATLFGGDGNDTIQAGGGSAVLDGGGGDDTLRGGTGGNVLIGGDGSDVLYGGSGHNTVVARGDGTNTYVSGGGTVAVDGGADVTAPQFAPNLEPVTSAGGPVAVGSDLLFSARYQDLDAALNVNDSLTATWDWGNGVTSTAPVASLAGNLSQSYTYQTAGVYTVKLTLTDGTGATSTSTYRYAVVYDPSAGYVSGGGWITSPAGAFAADPTATGRATFGFVSQYKKGANVPTGNTEFQFKAGNLNFASTGYDWLVVGGNKAKYKGSGTINGQGNFGFMLTVVDGRNGGADTFRLKIWDASTGAVVYDNMMGLPDDSDAGTTIGGGSIVIRS